MKYLHSSLLSPTCLRNPYLKSNSWRGELRCKDDAGRVILRTIHVPRTLIVDDSCLPFSPAHLGDCSSALQLPSYPSAKVQASPNRPPCLTEPFSAWRERLNALDMSVLSASRRDESTTMWCSTTCDYRGSPPPCTI